VGCGGSGGSSNNNNNSNNNNSTNTTTVTSTAGSITPASAAANVAPLIVDAGPAGAPAQPNIAFVTVTVCGPNGSTTCETIDHIAVDTASVGLRIPYEVLGNPSSSYYNPTLLGQLSNVDVTVSGVSRTLADCIQFGDSSYFWGSVRLADVRMGGTTNLGNGTGSDAEVATAIPIHLIGDTALPSVPSSCSSSGGPNEDTVSALGANGLIGVGLYQYDCDVVGNPAPGTNVCTSASQLPSGTYYSCSGGSCTNTNLAVAPGLQIRNPVSKFTTDNNGVIVELNYVAPGVGATSIGGSLVFGIGTRSNNALSSSAVILAPDPNPNDAAWQGFTTKFNNVTYPSPSSTTSFGSILDTGSTDIFFLSKSITGIPTCGHTNPSYCPTNTENLTAYNLGYNSSISSEVTFSVAGPETTGTTATSDSAAPALSGSGVSFDWGLPFFYGRNVYTSIWGVAPPTGVQAGPWWAY
jgi:hypothetical protein